MQDSPGFEIRRDLQQFHVKEAVFRLCSKIGAPSSQSVKNYNVCIPCSKRSAMHKLLSCLLVWATAFLAAGQLATALPTFQHAHLLTDGTRWPEYSKGKGNYQWVLSEQALQNGITYLGAASRLRVALDKLVRGEKVVIGTSGGSITATGHWLVYFINYLKDHYGSNIELANGAVPATQSIYASACHGVHVSNESDIIIIEYAFNDRVLATPPVVYRSAEKLLRTLMNYPKQPAIVYVNTIPWRKKGYENWWMSIEGLYSELASYYNIPSVSLRSCCFHLLAEGTARGFSTVPRNTDLERNANHSFYSDASHPDVLTGSRVLAEITINLFETVIKGLQSKPVTDADVAGKGDPMPPPLLPHSQESTHSMCYVGEPFHAKIIRNTGFEWVNENHSHKVAKWGMVSYTPGSQIDVLLDTRSGSEGASDAHVTMLLIYLASYERMGRGIASCISGCQCNDTLFDGHNDVHYSYSRMQEMLITQSEECVMRITVADTTSSNDHKLKMIGFAISGVADVGQETGMDFTGYQGTSRLHKHRHRSRHLLSSAHVGQPA